MADRAQTMCNLGYHRWRRGATLPARFGAATGVLLFRCMMLDVNFGRIVKVFDTVMSLMDARSERDDEEPRQPGKASPAAGFAEQIETHLTNVVVAALKEAFNRDQVRLDMERVHLEEQRRRAEENVRLEARRQAVDREVTRLRLLAGAALAGWIFSVVLLVVRSGQSLSARSILGAASLLCLGSLACAFIGQSGVAAAAAKQDRPTGTPASGLALGFLVAGFVLTTVTLLLR